MNCLTDDWDDDVLIEALAICVGDPEIRIRRSRSSSLRGLIAADEGHTRLSIDVLLNAIRQNPTSELYNALGDQLITQGRVKDGLGAHVRAVLLSPAEPSPRVRLADALARQARYAEALTLYGTALDDGADVAPVRMRRADTLHKCGRLEKAFEEYRDITSRFPGDHEGHVGIGQVLVSMGEYDLALQRFYTARDLCPGRSEIHTHIGDVLTRLNRLNEAEQEFRAALNADPSNLLARRHLVQVLELLGRHADASGAWVALGDGLAARDLFDAASSSYRQAIVRNPRALRAHLSLANVLTKLGNSRQAAETLGTALAIAPGCAEAHVNFGILLHGLGDRERGLDELAWVHHRDDSAWRHVEQPLWDGSPLCGRTILLWARGRASDVIFHLRYAQFAQAMGGVVTVECERSLAPIARLAAGVNHVSESGRPCRPFDVHAPLTHLPSLIRSARRCEIQFPYITIPNTAQTPVHFCRHIIAFVDPCDSSTRHELSLEDTQYSTSDRSAIARLCHHVCKGGAFEAVSHGRRLHLLNRRQSIVEIAAIISGSDLVIGDDTPAVHLAGAMAQRVWTLLPRGVSWPWPQDADRTSLYPTMKLFRLNGPEVWTTLFNDLRTL